MWVNKIETTMLGETWTDGYYFRLLEEFLHYVNQFMFSLEHNCPVSRKLIAIKQSKKV